MTRRGFLWIAGIGVLSGCGGGGRNEDMLKPSSGRAEAKPFINPDLGLDYGDRVAGVEVRWEMVTELDASQIAAYQIYRDDELIGSVDSRTTVWIDHLPALPFMTPLPAPTLIQVPTPSPWEPSALITKTVTPPWLTIGATHRYEVRVLYQFNGTYLEGLRYTEPAYATPLDRTSLLHSRDELLLDFFSVSYQPTRGANEYVMEIAANPDFTGGVRYGPYPQEYTQNPQRIPVNDVTDRITIPVGSPAYIRIGARRTLDTSTPKSEYIWSATNTYTVVTR